MITKFELNNFGPLSHILWENPGKINLIIGHNGCVKTFPLKQLYSALRTIEA